MIKLKKRAIHETPVDHILFVEWDVIVDGKPMPFTLDSVMEGYASRERAAKYAFEPYGYELIRKIAYAVAKTSQAIAFFDRLAAALWPGDDEDAEMRVRSGVTEYKPPMCSKFFRLSPRDALTRRSALQLLDGRLDLFESALFEAEGRFTAATVLQIMEGVLKEIYAAS